jgi:hypothetical protein
MAYILQGKLGNLCYMGRFVCVIVMFLCLSGLNAQNLQDTISLQPNDSVGIKRDSVLIRQINSENIFRRKVIEIDSSYFDKKEVKKQLRIAYPDYRQWRIGLNGGVERIIAPEAINISEELSKYRKSLKSGARFGADVIFFISPNIGVGINYSTFGASNKTDYISYEINEKKYAGKRWDDIRIHFIGPAISIRSIPKHNKLYTSCDFTLGYFVYSNDLVVNKTTYNLREENFGFATSVGVDYMFMKNMSIGISLNITAASVKNVEILTGNNAENLSRISLVVTLKTYR